MSSSKRGAPGWEAAWRYSGWEQAVRDASEAVQLDPGSHKVGWSLIPVYLGLMELVIVIHTFFTGSVPPGMRTGGTGKLLSSCRRLPRRSGVAVNPAAEKCTKCGHSGSGCKEGGRATASEAGDRANSFCKLGCCTNGCGTNGRDLGSRHTGRPCLSSGRGGQLPGSSSYPSSSRCSRLGGDGCTGGG